MGLTRQVLLVSVAPCLLQLARPLPVHLAQLVSILAKVLVAPEVALRFQLVLETLAMEVTLTSLQAPQSMTGHLEEGLPSTLARVSTRMQDQWASLVETLS